MFEALQQIVFMDAPLQLIIYVFLALFIAWIWVDYFRLIDVFEKENFFRVVTIFSMGAASVLVVFAVHEIWYRPFGLEMNGTFFNDFLYYTLSIGLVEECAKSVPVIIALYLFRKHINEPIDYVATFSVAALGFAAAENVLYFSNYGADLISSRAILSNVGHMMFASLTAYGVILVKFRNLKPGWLIIPLFLLLGSIFHGLYDLGLMLESLGWIGVVATIAFFFVGVSVFSNILNNALNISPFFTYKHVVHSSRVAVRMLIYYALLFAVQCLIVWFFTDTRKVFALVFQHAFTILPIVLITVVRLSRFTLIKDRWNWIKPELPFSFGLGGRFGLRIGVKGDPYSDYHVNKHYESYFQLCPVARDSPYLRHCRKAFLAKKIYINGDVAHYITKVFTDENAEHSQSVLIQIKRGRVTMMNGYPVVAILDAANIDELETSTVAVASSFIEWAVLKPIPETPGSRP